MEAAIETTTQRPKRKRGGKALWLGLFVVLAVMGGRWLWRKIQFTELRVPLIRAVQAGNAATVRDLLDAGADPDVAVDYREEPFRLADLWRRLRGFHGETHDPGKTVLMVAAENNRPDIVTLLLQHGADLHRTVRLEFPMTALECAVCRRAQESIKVLVASGAVLNPKGEVEITPLCVSVLREDMGDDVSADDDVAYMCTELLLQLGADVNGRTYDGETALTFAVREPAPYAIRRLLAHGADVNAHDWNGVTPLMVAIRQGRTATARMLLDAGASADVQDDEGKTALMYAVAACEDGGSPPDMPALVRTLLQKGANLQIRNKSGETVLQIAERFGNSDVLTALRGAADASGAGRTIER